MRRHRGRARARRTRDEHIDAARWLPRVELPKEPGYVRFGAPAEDGRVPRDGIFVLARRALDELGLDAVERDAITDALDWFARHMPVCRPRDRRAVLFLRDTERELARRLWDLAHLLRSMGVHVEMVGVRRLEGVVAGDRVQVAAIRDARAR